MKPVERAGYDADRLIEASTAWSGNLFPWAATYALAQACHELEDAVNEALEDLR